MDLKGNITNLELFDVLRFLQISKKTGVLNLRFENFATKLFVKDGMLYFLSISDDAILEKLVMKSPDIDKSGYSQMIEKFRAHYRTTAGFDVYFFKSNIIPKEKERDFISNYISETLNYILLLSNGEFVFDEKQLPDVINFTVPLNFLPILAECKKRRDELAVMTKVIPSKRHIPVVVTNRKDSSRPLSLTPAIWNVLSLVNGKRNINNIISLSIENDFFVLKTLYNLLQSGYINLEQPKNEGNKSVNLVDSIKKILREQLGSKADRIPINFDDVKVDKHSLMKVAHDVERYVYMFVDDKKATKIDYLIKQLLIGL